MGRMSVLLGLSLVASLALVACSQREGQSSPDQGSSTASKNSGETSDVAESDISESLQPYESEASPAIELADNTEGYTSVFKNADGELLCPVMEVILDSEDVAEGFQDYKGVRYWFSTAESAAMFHENPQKFAK